MHPVASLRSVHGTLPHLAGHIHQTAVNRQGLTFSTAHAAAAAALHCMLLLPLLPLQLLLLLLPMMGCETWTAHQPTGGAA
jgi:hypothetical protein